MQGFLGVIARGGRGEFDHRSRAPTSWQTRRAVTWIHRASRQPKRCEPPDSTNPTQPRRVGALPAGTGPLRVSQVSATPISAPVAMPATMGSG